MRDTEFRSQNTGVEVGPLLLKTDTDTDYRLLIADQSFVVSTLPRGGIRASRLALCVDGIPGSRGETPLDRAALAASTFVSVAGRPSGSSKVSLYFVSVAVAC